ncbi:hypothetical protein LAZ67_20000662 [Cordylochernes scorpioides]|uniref:Integrase catalytic domain-containing protein n=1 Tax=Cordylochernes scorpioides TaxID=51811 RepID=A0ABY6LM66_9ARAC|nr:hypothetical protein LAZ67_20000662 [Cordylochernes scorpioides]
MGWRTLLGWTVGGNFDDLMETQGCVNYTVLEPVNDNDLHELNKSSFSTENFRVIPRTRWQGMNQVEGLPYDILQKTTKRTRACWETGLLWRDAEGTLAESYQMLLGRLRHTVRKLAKDPLLLAAYKAKFDEYLEKGYIRKLDSIEVTKESARTWCIPHFGVTNPNKPGKLRLVFDAAARSNGVSLNEALSKGPDLIRPLTSVLWNFRVHNIALTGDITDMFHRVRVIKEDQCSQRFLWRNMNTSIDPDHYEMQVFIFGATSSPCSAIHVKNENAMQHELVNHELAQSIVNDFYVDDCLTGADSEENCMDLRRELSESCKAYVLGTRFAVLLRSELRLPKVDREVFWSVSKTVLAWIRSEAGRYKGPEEEWPKGKGKDLGIILATRMLKLEDDSRVSPSSVVECGWKSGKLIKKINFSYLNRLIFQAAAVQKAARFWYKNTFHKTNSFTVSPEEYSRILQANKVLAEHKIPPILPSDHHVTELLIQAEHERCAHLGSETLLNNLRGKFWIIDGRQTVLRTILKCPRLAAYQRPFTFTGLYAFGRFTVTDGRRHEKRWVIIFTCLVTLAIHLEVENALTTDKFMMGLSRFIDTRGRPDSIYSDNGTNFVGASKELKLAASEIHIEVMAASRSFGPVKWKFNPPAAPHFGGAWECLIKSLKKCLRDA